MQHDADARRLFEALVREHAGSLTALLVATLDDRHAVDDLFQETCIVAWRKLHTFDQSRPFGPWFRGIARNLVLAHARRTRTVLLSDQLDAVEQRVQEVERRPGDTFEDKLEALRACLDRLPDKYRAALETKYLHGLSLEESAARLEVTFEGLKKRLLRGRTLLRECLASRGMLPKSG